MPKQFPAAMRGYDRAAVDAWRQEIADLVARLEEQPPADTAVRQALDEVGQGDGLHPPRAQRSRRRRSSRAPSPRPTPASTAPIARWRSCCVRPRSVPSSLEEDARTIWDERVRLIDEMRALADEVLGVADDALERVEPPSGRRPEPAAETNESDVIDTVEDEPTLEAEDGEPEALDTTQEALGAPDETQMLPDQGDTEAFDAQDEDEPPVGEAPSRGFSQP